VDVSVGSTSRLLCHDDRLEGRRIAFILYLSSEEWDDSDGGMASQSIVFLSVTRDLQDISISSPLILTPCSLTQSRRHFFPNGIHFLSSALATRRTIR
jgi:hypothetical protein